MTPGEAPPDRSYPEHDGEFRPWGRLHPRPDRVRSAAEATDRRALFGAGTLLPFGNGRSYGDVCVNREGELLAMRSVRGIQAFDETSGRIRVGAGTLLSEILEFAVPRGWFLPVTPGTQYVTVGGAVANDVHGKNHHAAGTFGCHVTELTLLRSDGSTIVCGPGAQPEWFRATVGGLGLTGAIVATELRLIPVEGPFIDVESVRFGNLEEFFALSSEFDRRYPYTVSWVDCVASRSKRGRGWLMGGRHATRPGRPKRRAGASVPFTPPFSLVNGLSLRVFNALYFHRPVPRQQVTHYAPFFYPLDGIRNWNRLYGRRGFYQFQCVVPGPVARDALDEMLSRIARLREGSFLAVLKQFGDHPAPGLLSFPRPGATLALDFPNRGRSTLALMGALEQIAMEAGGALYPAKDACMSSATFERSYPRWPELERLRDPAIESDFWRRVTAGLGSGL